MEGEAAPSFPPEDPILAGGVQLGNFLWTGVDGRGDSLVFMDLFGAGDDGDCLEFILPRMLAKDEDNPGVDCCGETLLEEIEDGFIGVSSFFGVIFNFTGFLL